MINLDIRFEDNEVSSTLQNKIRNIAQFTVDKYCEGKEVKDLDKIYIQFVTPTEDPNAYGRAYDGEDLDVITIRNDAFKGDDITLQGLTTLCHEFVHLGQYITDFDRRYDVPYRQRPQEVEAFSLADSYAEAWLNRTVADSNP